MNTYKQMMQAFKITGATGLQFEKTGDLYKNIQFLINHNWIKFNRDAILHLQVMNSKKC